MTSWSTAVSTPAVPAIALFAHVRVHGLASIKRALRLPLLAFSKQSSGASGNRENGEQNGRRLGKSVTSSGAPPSQWNHGTMPLAVVCASQSAVSAGDFVVCRQTMLLLL